MPELSASDKFKKHIDEKYPEYRIIRPFKDAPEAFFFVDDFDLYRWKKGVIDETFSFKTKNFIKNDKPTKYWILGNNARIPVATSILTAFKGPRPGGYCLNYKDGNRDNCRLSNLEWKLKENKSGRPVGITEDKKKGKWRIQRPGLKRTCHNSKEEAIAALIAQGAYNPVEDNDDDDVPIVEPDELPEPEELSPEEIAEHIRLDKQFDENEKRLKEEAEKYRIKFEG
jgi:hypothetical protein